MWHEASDALSQATWQANMVMVATNAQEQRKVGARRRTRWEPFMESIRQQEKAVVQWRWEHQRQERWQFSISQDQGSVNWLLVLQ
jgi:hypothetical protein